MKLFAEDSYQYNQAKSISKAKFGSNEWTSGIEERMDSLVT